MNFYFYLALVFALILLAYTRMFPRFVKGKQTHIHQEPPRFFDSIEHIILHKRSIARWYIVLALVTVVAILVSWIGNVFVTEQRNFGTHLMTTSLKTLALLSLWGAFFLPFFSKFRTLNPDDRSALVRFVWVGVVLAIVLLALLAIGLALPRLKL